MTQPTDEAKVLERALTLLVVVRDRIATAPFTADDPPGEWTHIRTTEARKIYALLDMIEGEAPVVSPMVDTDVLAQALYLEAGKFNNATAWLGSRQDDRDFWRAKALRVLSQYGLVLNNAKAG